MLKGKVSAYSCVGIVYQVFLQLLFVVYFIIKHASFAAPTLFSVVLQNSGEKSLSHRLSNPETYYLLKILERFTLTMYRLSIKEKLIPVHANEIQHLENGENSPLFFLVIYQPP